MAKERARTWSSARRPSLELAGGLAEKPAGGNPLLELAGVSPPVWHPLRSYFRHPSSCRDAEGTFLPLRPFPPAGVVPLPLAPLEELPIRAFIFPPFRALEAFREARCGFFCCFFPFRSNSCCKSCRELVACPGRGRFLFSLRPSLQNPLTPGKPGGVSSSFWVRFSPKRHQSIHVYVGAAVLAFSLRSFLRGHEKQI